MTTTGVGESEASNMVTVVKQGSTNRKSHAGGSWSRQFIDEERVTGAASTLGFSHFPPGARTDLIQHAVEEVCYVVRGQGEIVTDGVSVPFTSGDAIHIPAGSWHGIHNPAASEPVEMVFTFPTPRYPDTQGL